MNFRTRSLGYIHPAGQTASVTAQLSGIPSGVNAQGQLVDAQGNPVLDQGGNPISINPTAQMQPPASMPAPTQQVVPQPSAPAPAPPAVAPVHPAARAGSMFFSFVITATLIAGASYVGAYYGAKHAHRTAV